MVLTHESVTLRRTVTLKTGENCIYIVTSLRYDNNTTLIKESVMRLNKENLPYRRYRTTKNKSVLNNSFERAKTFTAYMTKTEVIQVTA